MDLEFKRCGQGENVCNCKSEKECGYLSEDYEDKQRAADRAVNFEDEWDDDDYESCDECGSDKQWEICYSCGGEGGTDGEELMSEDPFWYGPEDFRTCDVCEGKGGFYVCHSCANKSKQEIKPIKINQ